MEGQEDPVNESPIFTDTNEMIGIRLEFGRDVDVAKWLIVSDETRISNWSFDGFDSNWSDVKSELLRKRECVQNSRRSS